MKYSAAKIFLEGIFGNRGWEKAWREPEPKKNYDIIIIGGGGLRRARERRARSKTTVPALEGEGRRGEASHKVLYFTCTFNDSTARILHIVLIRSRSRSNSRDSGVRAAA